MKLKIVFLFIIISGLSYSQTDKWRVYKPRGANAENIFFTILVDNNNNIWAAGYALYKFTGSAWQGFPGAATGGGQIFSLVADNSNNIFIGAGRGFDMYDGTQFTTLFPYPKSTAMWLAKGPDGSIWAGQQAQIGGETTFLAKLNNNTLTTYDKTDIGVSILNIYHVTVDKNGKVWGWGRFGDSNNNIYRLFSFDGNHWEIYNEIYTPVSFYHPVYVDADNNVWVGTKNNQVAKYDQSSGSWEAFSPLPSGSFKLNYISALAVDHNGVLWIGFDGGLAKKDGNKWALYNSSNSPLEGDSITDIKVDASNNLWLAVYPNTNGKGGVVEFNENGINSGTSAIKNSDNTPSTFSLSQNYPNPFNPETVIKYRVPKESFVTIAVYDMLGREVSRLVNGEKPAGSYEVSFSASSLSSGTYFYRITAGGFTSIKKMVLMK